MSCSRALILIAVVLTSWASAEARTLDRAARFDEGVEAYSTALAESDRAARLAGFARAQRAFASLVDDGVASAALYTNLGNAALQAQDRGAAVLAYHRALRLDPERRAARQNLEHVRQRLPAWVPRPSAESGFEGLFDDRLVPRVWRARGAAFAFLLGSIGVVMSIRVRAGAWRGFAVSAFVVWGVLFGSTFVGGAADRPLAVLIASETTARSADSSLAALALPEALPGGVEVDLLEAREGWARVRLANGRDVWVRRANVARVEPEDG